MCLRRAVSDSTTLFGFFHSEHSGAGEIRLTCGGHTAVLPLQPGHKGMGANFNRFGFVTPWIDGNGQVVYFDDLRYTYDIPTTARFSATPTSGPAPLEVTFTDESVSKTPIAGWTWDFGDGSAPSHDRNPVHIYTENGAYTVSLTVSTAVDSNTLSRQWFIDIGDTLPGPVFPALAFLVIALGGCAARRLRR